MKLILQQPKNNPKKRWWKFWEPLFVYEPVGYVEVQPLSGALPNIQESIDYIDQALEADGEAWYNPEEESGVVVAEPDFIPIKRYEAQQNELQNPTLQEPSDDLSDH